MTLSFSYSIILHGNTSLLLICVNNGFTIYRLTFPSCVMNLNQLTKFIGAMISKEQKLGETPAIW